MEKITLDKQLLIAIVNYLAERPFKEVQGLIAPAVQALQPAEPQGEAKA